MASHWLQLPLLFLQLILLMAARENVFKHNSIPIVSLLMSPQSLLLELRVNSQCLAVTYVAGHCHHTDSSPALLAVCSLLLTLLSICFLDTLSLCLRQVFLSQPPAWTDFLPDYHRARDAQPDPPLRVSLPHLLDSPWMISSAFTEDMLLPRNS